MKIMCLGLVIIISCLAYVLFGIITVTVMVIIAKDRVLRAEADGNLKKMKKYWYHNDTFEYYLLFDCDRELNIVIFILLWPLCAITWIVKSITTIPYKISYIFMKDTKYIKEGDRYIKTKRKESEFEEY